MTADERLEALLGRAFARVDAAEANSAIAAQRAARASGGGEALSYEAALPPSGPWDALLTQTLPKLVYFLDCRGARLPHVGGVFVSLFVGDALYFLEVGDVIEAASDATGLSAAEMVRRWGAASVP